MFYVIREITARFNNTRKLFSGLPSFFITRCLCKPFVVRSSRTSDNWVYCVQANLVTSKSEKRKYIDTPRIAGKKQHGERGREREIEKESSETSENWKTTALAELVAFSTRIHIAYLRWHVIKLSYLHRMKWDNTHDEFLSLCCVCQFVSRTFGNDGTRAINRKKKSTTTSNNFIMNARVKMTMTTTA